MRLSELIERLEELKRENGDIQVVYETFSHRWSPEPVVKEYDGQKRVLLNP